MTHLLSACIHTSCFGDLKCRPSHVNPLVQAQEVSLADLVSKLSVTAGDSAPANQLPTAPPQQPATPDSTQEEPFAEYSQTPWTVLEDAEAERPLQEAAHAAGRSLVAVPAAVRCAACSERHYWGSSRRLALPVHFTGNGRVFRVSGKSIMLCL